MKKETVKATCISDQGSVMQQKNWEQLSAEIVGKMGVKIGAELIASAMILADNEGKDPEEAVKLTFHAARVFSRGFGLHKRGQATSKTYREENGKKKRNETMRFTHDVLERLFDHSVLDSRTAGYRDATFFVPAPLTREVRRIDAYNRAETDQERADALKPIDYTKQARKNYALISAMQKSHIVADCVIQGDVFTDGSNTLEAVDTFTISAEVVSQQRDAMRTLIGGLTNRQAEAFRSGLRVWRADEWHTLAKTATARACERIAERAGLRACELFEAYSRLYA